MIKITLAILLFLAFNSPILAHEIEQTCTDQAFDQTIHYCYKLYRRRSNAFASCKLGAAHTYEALLMGESTSNREICTPYFLRSCDSGRKLMITKQKELCQ